MKEESRFPIRCTIEGGHTACDAPAVMAVTCTTATCPCPPRDVPICAAHVEPWGQVGTSRQRQVCRACRQITDYAVTATRPLNEGDLPDIAAAEETAPSQVARVGGLGL